MDLFVSKQEFLIKKRSPLLLVVAALSIHSMLFLFFLADAMTWMYQEVYFSIMGIPKIPRSKYVLMKRHTLRGLNPIQKWSCWYCEYVNGVISWMKEVANQTEIFSCSIKYTYQRPGQEYQKDFYAPEQFKTPFSEKNVVTPK